jgi:DegV family protein with EDD domain
MSVSIVVDSASDLPVEEADRLGIVRVPLTIAFGEEEFQDGVELTREQFWARMATEAELPRTAAPSPTQFQNVFTEALEGGAEGVVCLTLSQDLSATYQAAVQAAAEFGDRVKVLDTRTLTLSEGLVALAAAEAAQSGADLAACVEVASSTRDRVLTFGTLDSLENLRKGGRIGAAQALVGALMSFKPLIEVRDGGIEPAGRVRTRKNAIAALMSLVEGRGPFERVGLVHAMAPDLGTVLPEVERVTGADSVVVSVMGATIGTHAGPGALGICLVRAAG